MKFLRHSSCRQPSASAVIFLSLIFYLVFAIYVNAQILKESCADKITCDDCMKAGAHCDWCSNKLNDKKTIGSRCMRKEDAIKNCPNNRETNVKSKLSSVRNESLSTDAEAKEKKFEKIVQLQPQEVNISLRPGQTHSFYVNYRLSKNFPIDLYYLLDLSNSQCAFLQALGELSSILNQQMSNLTEGIVVKLGGFVDKPVPPFAMGSLAVGSCGKCRCGQAHSFYHISDGYLRSGGKMHSSDVKQAITKMHLAVNQDSFEGGADALMQAMICEKQVRWRKNARKWIVHVSDNPMHLALDGKLGGIVTPNDGKCHLAEKTSGELTYHYYDKELVYDYPSLGQLQRVILDNDYTVLFAVTHHKSKQSKDTASRKAESRYKNTLRWYNELKLILEGTSVVTFQLQQAAGSNGLIDKDPIVNALRKAYNSLFKKVQLVTQTDSDLFDIRFDPLCPGKVSADKTGCENLEVGEMVKFKVSVTLKRCPKDDETTRFEIKAQGIEEAVTVNIIPICNCDCSQTTKADLTGTGCLQNGTDSFQCGGCKCKEGFEGITCECDSRKEDNPTENCLFYKDVSDEPICSGRGSCKCGICTCNKDKFQGRACQCDKSQCRIGSNDTICGHGTCVCGTEALSPICDCDEGWKRIGGDLAPCDCSKSQDQCKSADQDELCGGKGTCECNKCKCKDKWRGAKCDYCPDCEGICLDNKQCVIDCVKNKDGRVCEKCQGIMQQDKETNFTFVYVNKLTEKSNVDGEYENCQNIFDDDECQLFYAFNYTERILYVQKTKACGEPLPPWVIILIIVGIILLIGIIILIIWRIYTWYVDKQEMAKFNADQAKARWNEGENPLYTPATTTIQNPTYVKH